ncbi:tRNA (adenosine(37)-N6)-threonylcarbamoyltransferase complex ATPase subunit type 1 TsaE [Roseixanthobacter glucoisosaccharinicivorans]|uniref:tRNA (adenosine(37)-N6)-threonylcarbamoyltransferase complex ATPase subunit type 1 TsaE n=1 Tax=Roseixanthobacter glucoisosaccharinicivorans TaxID=3119923 RepID=UPI0037267192
MSPLISRVPGLPNAFRMDLPDLEATGQLAALLAPWLAPGDLVALRGDLGAGKTAFARALVRVLADDPALEVPSPTFSVLVGYEFARVKVTHADLYRVEDPDELDELGWEELSADSIVIVEWPDRAAERLAADRLIIEFDLAPDLGPEGRRAILSGSGAFIERLDRLHVSELLIEASGFGAAERRYMQGDASSRSYARLVLPDRSAVLMNAPRRPDGPPIRRGLPYSRLAHLAEDVRAFVAMARGLRAQGFSAPQIYAADLDRGLLVIEDLGDGGVLEGSPPEPIKARYEVAAEVLAALHAQSLPHVLHIAPQSDYVLPVYGIEAFLIELELMLDWYLPFRNVRADAVVRDEFLMLWRNALSPVLNEPQTWVLRDYHSPNLIWLPQREGLQRMGLIDFQDAVLGPAAYDVASLAQDARVDIPENLELHIVGHYVAQRREADPTFDARAFTHLYALMGAQRATKILGIFTRLHQRDGKPQYLRHLPRVRRYLARCLGHQELGSLRMWYEAVLPSKDLQT